MKLAVRFLLWVLIPFAIGAIWDNFGFWYGFPALVVGGTYWFRLCVIMGKQEEK